MNDRSPLPAVNRYVPVGPAAEMGVAARNTTARVENRRMARSREHCNSGPVIFGPRTIGVKVRSFAQRLSGWRLAGFFPWPAAAHNDPLGATRRRSLAEGRGSGIVRRPVDLPGDLCRPRGGRARLALPEEIPVVTAGVLCAQAASPDAVPAADWTAALAVPGRRGQPGTRRRFVHRMVRPCKRSRNRGGTRSGGSCCRCASSASSRATRFLYGIGRLAGPAARRKALGSRNTVVKPGKAGEDRTQLPQVRRPHRCSASGCCRAFARRCSSWPGSSGCRSIRFLLADGIYAIPVVTLLFTLAYWFTDSVVRGRLTVSNGQVGSLKHVLHHWRHRGVRGLAGLRILETLGGDRRSEGSAADRLKGDQAAARTGGCWR